MNLFKIKKITLVIILLTFSVISFAQRTFKVQSMVFHRDIGTAWLRDTINTSDIVISYSDSILMVSLDSALNIDFTDEPEIYKAQSASDITYLYENNNEKVIARLKVLSPYKEEYEIECYWINNSLSKLIIKKEHYYSEYFLCN